MRPVIVSFTSWKKRINLVSKLIFSLYSQTLKPQKIYLNLSSDEFPGGLNDLPEDLQILAKDCKIFEINWVKENTKAFKKLIPILWKYKNDDCWIVTVDDDVMYNSDYLEYLVTNAEKNFGKVINPRVAGNWLHGAFGCYHPSYFKNQNIFKITIDEMIEMIMDDTWYNECYKENGISDFPLVGLKRHFKMSSGIFPLHNTYGNSNHLFKVKKKIKEILERKN